MTVCRDTVKRAERLWLGIVLQAVTMRDFGTSIALRTVMHVFLLEGLCIQSQRSTRRLRLMTSLLSLILSVLVVADHWAEHSKSSNAKDIAEEIGVLTGTAMV